MNCQMIEESIRGGLSDWTRVISLDSGECLVRLPFWDDAGDPIELTVAVEGGRATIDDSGSIAGLLFSLGQDEQGTPAFKLLGGLERSHGLEIDFDEGLVRVSVAEDDLYDGVAEMTKVVLAMHTAVPQLRVAPRHLVSHGSPTVGASSNVPSMQASPRRAGSLGPRLRSRIERRYSQLEILDLVQRSYTIAGATVSDWPIDFHWSVRTNESSYEVNVVAADLRVSDPFAKAHKIVSLSVDTREQHQSGDDRLRVVVESKDNNTQSLEAGDFLRFHSGELDYRVFDLRQQDENSEFFDLSKEELTRGVLERR